MDKLMMGIKRRIEILKKAIQKANEEKDTFPEGSLRVSASKRQVRYYWLNAENKRQGDYIKKEERNIAVALARKAYNKDFLLHAEKELKELERCVAVFAGENGDRAYQKLSVFRKKLILPYIITDEQYSDRWQNIAFKSNPYRAEMKIYDTHRGEKVRSKSEAILADMFWDMGIPYHYEKPLRLRGGNVCYPDFTLLRDRKEIYLEHFGLLDDEEYRQKSIQKLNEYRRNGIFFGKNLIITYESEQCPLDIKGIRTMIKELFRG